MNIDINKKYRTADGREVTHLHRAPESWSIDGPWRGVVGKQPACWDDDGTAPYAPAGWCLVEVREPREWKAVVLLTPTRTLKAGTLVNYEEGDEKKSQYEVVTVREVIDA